MSNELNLAKQVEIKRQKLSAEVSKLLKNFQDDTGFSVEDVVIMYNKSKGNLDRRLNAIDIIIASYFTTSKSERY